MMISDDDRREVVARLRNGGVARDPEEAYTLLLWCVGIRPQLPATSTYEDAMVRLADLIDRPTCMMSDIGDDVEQIYRCSACGEEYCMSDVKPYPWRFCPNCGSVVVEEGVCDVREI